MEHLSLEHCQWLKSVGFPQDASYFVYTIGEDRNLTPFVYSRGRAILDWPNILCACPSLEELLEWAKTKTKCVIGWDEERQCYDVANSERVCFDPDPKVALIKLLKQVME